MRRLVNMSTLALVCLGAAITAAQASAAHPASATSTAAVKCPRAVGTLVDRLTAVETVIEGKTFFSKYASLTLAAKTAYNRIPVPQLKADCLLDVGIPAEKSMNKYIAAQNIWRQCILADDTCTKARYNAPMQRLWADAGKYLQKAINNLAD